MTMTGADVGASSSPTARGGLTHDALARHPDVDDEIGTWW